MGADKDRQRVFTRLMVSRERLQAQPAWFPYPCLLSFALVLLFTGHFLQGLNPRLGNGAEILDFAAEPAKEGSIWIAVSLDEDTVVVTTGDRKVFRWPAATTNLDALAPFIAYLQQRTVDLTLAASLATKVSHHQTLVVLALDQTLTYGHIRPLLYSLATAGISEYGFETRQPLASQD